MQLIPGQVESFIPVISFLFILYGNGFHVNNKFALWLCPLIVLTFNLCLYFTFGLLRDVFVWLIGVALITNPVNVHNYDRISKILFYAGLVYIASMLFELMFPDIYFTYYHPLFKGDFNELVFRAWTSERHIPSGLSHQIGFTVAYIVASIGLFVFVYMKSYTKKKGLLLLLFLFTGLLIAQKRTHFAVTVLSIGIVYLLGTPSKQKGKTVFLMIVVLIVCLFVALNVANYFGAENVLGRYEQSVDLSESGESISASRDLLRLEAISVWEDNMLFGIGWNRFGTLGFDYTTVHNVFLQLLCETGIIGALLILIPIFNSLSVTIKLIRRHSDTGNAPYLLFSAFYQIFFIVYFLTGNPLYDYPYLIPYFLSVSIAHFYYNNPKMIAISYE